jgi:hypothetical protein
MIRLRLSELSGPRPHRYAKRCGRVRSRQIALIRSDSPGFAATSQSSFHRSPLSFRSPVCLHCAVDVSQSLGSAFRSRQIALIRFYLPGLAAIHFLPFHPPHPSKITQIALIRSDSPGFATICVSPFHPPHPSKFTQIALIRFDSPGFAAIHFLPFHPPHPSKITRIGMIRFDSPDSPRSTSCLFTRRILQNLLRSL